jgi:hypothetical protein
VSGSPGRAGVAAAVFRRSDNRNGALFDPICERETIDAGNGTYERSGRGQTVSVQIPATAPVDHRHLFAVEDARLGELLRSLRPED